MARARRGFKHAKKVNTYTVMTDIELHELLEEVGLEKIKTISGHRGTNFMFCCPFHVENRPSAGILNSDEGIYGQCYSCEETFSLPKLIAHVRSEEFEDAVDFLDQRYNSVKREIDISDRSFSYESKFKKEGGLKVLDDVELAPYRSGKATHKYFFKRGFTKDTMKECLVGWDRVRKRITVPMFHSDGTLAGFSGRAVLEQKTPNGNYSKKYESVYGKSPKYYLYDNVEIGNILFGSHEFPEGEDTAIIVEGMFDRLWLRQIGYKNALATIIAKMTAKKDGTSKQKEILHDLGVKKIIFMQDNDEAGDVGKERAYKILGRDFECYDVKYPEGYKDVMGGDGYPPLEREDIEEMLRHKKKYGMTDLSALLIK